MQEHGLTDGTTVIQLDPAAMAAFELNLATATRLKRRTAKNSCAGATRYRRGTSRAHRAKPSTRRSSASRTARSSGDGGDSGQPGSESAPGEPAPQTLLEALHEQTPHLTGAARLAAFLSWPVRVQDLAFDQLAARSRRDWR